VESPTSCVCGRGGRAARAGCGLPKACMLPCTCMQSLSCPSEPHWDAPAAAPSSAPGYLPHDLAHLDATRLVQQQHLNRAPRLGFQLLPRPCSAQKIRGLRACGTRVGGLGKMICARCEQHLADLADQSMSVRPMGGTNHQMRHRSSATAHLTACRQCRASVCLVV
jgi:hypothetical protein